MGVIEVMALLLVLGLGLFAVCAYHLIKEEQEAETEQSIREWAERKRQHWEELKERRFQEEDRIEYLRAIDFAALYPQGLVFSTKEEIPQPWQRCPYLIITYVLDKDNRVIGYKITTNFSKTP